MNVRMPYRELKWEMSIDADNTTFVTENVTTGHYELTVKTVRDGTATTAHYEANRRLGAE